MPAKWPVAWLRDCLGQDGWPEMTPRPILISRIYDSEQRAENSRAKPLSVNQYFTRLTQRLINSITAPTGEGVLFSGYALRPSGSRGPWRPGLESFRLYQKRSA